LIQRQDACRIGARFSRPRREPRMPIFAPEARTELRRRPNRIVHRARPARSHQLRAPARRNPALALLSRADRPMDRWPDSTDCDPHGWRGPHPRHRDRHVLRRLHAEHGHAAWPGGRDLALETDFCAERGTYRCSRRSDRSGKRPSDQPGGSTAGSAIQPSDRSSATRRAAPAR
jgi:hypothetical protein